MTPAEVIDQWMEDGVQHRWQNTPKWQEIRGRKSFCAFQDWFFKWKDSQKCHDGNYKYFNEVIFNLFLIAALEKMHGHFEDPIEKTFAELCPFKFPILYPLVNEVRDIVSLMYHNCLTEEDIALDRDRNKKMADASVVHSCVNNVFDGLLPILERDNICALGIICRSFRDICLTRNFCLESLIEEQILSAILLKIKTLFDKRREQLENIDDTYSMSESFDPFADHFKSLIDKLTSSLEFSQRAHIVETWSDSD